MSVTPLPSPAAIVLDLDGVLVDVVVDRALTAVEDLAAIAARCPVAVVTSCPLRLTHALLERHGFAPHVTATVCSEDGPGKPRPDPVLLALERLDKAGAPAWMLGDNPSDVQAARAAGVAALAVQPRGVGRESLEARLRVAGAERVVAGVAGLRALLDEATLS